MVADFEKLISELKALYPNNNIEREFENCVAWYRTHNNGTVTPRRFRDWMEKAEPELKRDTFSTRNPGELPETGEPTDEERAKHKQIAHELVTKLRDQLRRQ